MMLDTLRLQLCDIQGKLFELSAKKGYDSKAFIESYMNSDTAAFFDLPYDRMQWAGIEYMLENLIDEGKDIPKTNRIYSMDTLYWAGYIYRYWHFLTGESSRDIYAIANAKTMQKNYLGFHTIDNELTVENLKELNKSNDYSNNS